MIEENRVNEKLNKSFKKLLFNFFFLSVGQGLTFILPLLLTPFLINLIGVSKYAVVMVCQSVMTYFSIFTDYGFNLSATQQCSVNRNDKNKLSIIVSEVFSTKLFLLLTGFFILSLVAFIIPYFEEYRTILLLSYGLVIAKVIFPTWFFQGVEEMKKMSFFIVFAKLILLFLFFLFYKMDGVFIYINIIFAAGDIIVGIISLFYIRYFFLKKHIYLISYHNILKILKNDYLLFLTNFTNNIYINSNIIILSIFVSTELVGFFAVAEKIMVAGKNIAAVVLQATYPRACKIAIESSSKFKIFLKSEFYFFIFLFFLVGVFTYSLSTSIVFFLIGHKNDVVSNYVKYLSFVPLIVSLNMPAYKVLIIYNLKYAYSTTVIIGAIINIILNFILIPIYKVEGTIITIIITEVFITLSFHLILHFRFAQYKFLN